MLLAFRKPFDSEERKTNLSMVSLDSLNIVFIKRFKLPEPVFWPNQLVGSMVGNILSKPNFKFLSDPEKINQLINKNKRFELKEGWIFKPIKNLSMPKDNFWRPFKYEPAPINLTGRKRLPFYPFQIIIKDRLKINKNILKNALGSEIIDCSVNSQVRIFPPGAGAAHLYIHIKPDKINLDAINNILDFEKIIIRYRDKETNLFDFFNRIINSVVNEIAKENSTREVKGIYTIINFHGNELHVNENLSQLSKILTGNANPTSEEIETEKNKLLENKLFGQDENDLLAVSKKVSIIYIDQGLKKIHSKIGYSDKIQKGRHCFRNHFINTVELAYVTDLLIDEYNKHFSETLNEIRISPIDKSFHVKLNRLFKANVLDPCAYSTLMYSILPVSENLHEIPWTYYVYAQAFREFDISQKFKTIQEITKNLLEKAERWNVQADMMRNIDNEIKDWAGKIAAIIKP